MTDMLSSSGISSITKSIKIVTFATTTGTSSQTPIGMAIDLLAICSDILEMAPYAKYMKDIVTNKRKILEVEISTMLANYSFKDGVPKKLGDLGIPTIPCSIKRSYVKTVLCDLGAVLVLCLSLYTKDLI